MSWLVTVCCSLASIYFMVKTGYASLNDRRLTCSAHGCAAFLMAACAWVPYAS